MTADDSLKTPVRVALLGCGTVASGLLDILSAHADRVTRCSGGPVEIVGVAVRSLDRPRHASLAADQLTDDAAALVARSDVDLVVELMGGVEPAHSLILHALKAGKPVVTANKAVVAQHGATLEQAALSAGVSFHFEAAAAGAVPIVKVLSESLQGNRVERLMGIVNGTCNYILTQMTESGADFEDALTDAQKLGFAEADPSSDVEGHDAAYKLCLLANFAFGSRPRMADISCEGISSVSAEDVQRADRLGYVIKLLAIGSRQDNGLDLRVHPTLVPHTHPLASVRGAYNAVFIDGDSSGPLMLYGQGAGRAPTASAVSADLIDACLMLRGGTDKVARRRVYQEPLKSLAPSEAESRYYISMRVADEPGVLAAVASAFAQHKVSVESCLQEGRGTLPVDLIFVTHTVNDGALRASLAQIATLNAVLEITSTMRVLS